MYHDSKFYYRSKNLKKKDSHVSLTLFPSPYLQNEDFKDFKFMLYSKRLLDQYEVWSKEIDNLMVKEQELTSFNEIFFLAKIRRVHTEFLKDLKDKNLIEIISKCWSRVRIVSFSSERNVKMVMLHYCDFGFESFFHLNDLSLYKYPIRARLDPKFSYELTLSKQDLLDKLAQIRAINDFIDLNYLNKQMNYEFLGKIPLRVDFSRSLISFKEASSQDSYAVEIYNKVTNQNIIDSIIENAVMELKKYVFPCIISHINSLDDFYIQKVDPVSQEALNNLQAEIQTKINDNALKKLESSQVALNKLCVAFYGEDSQYYRAKIIAIYNSERKVDFLLSFNLV